jgi:two-component system, LytTR family, sensor kinase
MKAFFFRYKLHHLLFWALYGYIWWIFYDGDAVGNFRAIFTTPMALKFSAYLAGQMFAVCFNLYVLIPRFLEKNKLAVYTACLLATVFITTALVVFVAYYGTAYLSGLTIHQKWGDDFSFFRQYWSTTFPSVVAAVTLGMSIKLTKNWIQAKQRQQALEKEKLETELTFLKNQFNPHFLFNTINSIFFLIHKNPDKASDSLAKFSELLRYQLYECNDRQIPLTSEVAYMENFVGLEKLRQNDNVSVSLLLNQPSPASLGIAPFVLMTFVENAFKHVSKHTDRDNWIRINLDMNQRELNFCIANSASGEPAAEAVHYRGIGLKNVRRRLDLIYPGQYDLDIQNGPGSFDVRLRLQLMET